MSVIKRCQLLGGSLRKIVTFGSKRFVRYSRHVRLWDVRYRELSLYFCFVRVQNKTKVKAPNRLICNFFWSPKMLNVILFMNKFFVEIIVSTKKVFYKAFHPGSVNVTTTYSFIRKTVCDNIHNFWIENRQLFQRLFRPKFTWLKYKTVQNHCNKWFAE